MRTYIFTYGWSRESNPQPWHYKGHALPTELQRSTRQLVITWQRQLFSSENTQLSFVHSSLLITDSPEDIFQLYTCMSYLIPYTLYHDPGLHRALYLSSELSLSFCVTLPHILSLIWSLSLCSPYRCQTIFWKLFHTCLMLSSHLKAEQKAMWYTYKDQEPWRYTLLTYSSLSPVVQPSHPWNTVTRMCMWPSECMHTHNTGYIAGSLVVRASD